MPVETRIVEVLLLFFYRVGFVAKCLGSGILYCYHLTCEGSEGSEGIVHIIHGKTA